MSQLEAPVGAVAAPADRDQVPLIETRNLTRHFKVGGNFSRKRLHAVDNVNLVIHRKEIVALETAAIQRAALMGGSPAEQVARIEAFVESLENGTARKEMIATANAWASGDLDALSGALATLKPAERAALDRIVFARNPALAARIDELHRGWRRIFATAGIMHMIGDNGLPKLLAARGFKVERVVFEAQ